MSSELKIVGSQQFYIWEPEAKVFLDQNQIGQISSKDTKSFRIPPGQHRMYVEFQVLGILRKSNTLEFRVNDGENVTVRYSGNQITGGLKLERLT